MRRELLVDAAFDLLGTEGGAGTTVRAVCQRARLNPRYFYESFDDLDELIVAVYDRVVLELRQVVIDALESAPPDPREQLRATIGQIVQFVDDDRRRAKVLYVEALGNESLNRRRLATGHAVVEAVQAYSDDHHGPLAPGEPIGGLAAAILVGGLSELLVSWIDGRLDVSRTQLIDDATALFAALGETAA
ncbi:MAG TPA: TetR/AcrR family transcriptional regulator, partial [Microthrixaceae bacterium]|nr:TetR/AcrR family transcriptional regulator [Microthrixaceae bacterium]